MSRIVLAGLGGPIPTTAIPDPNIDDNYPNVALVLEDGVPFDKTDWEAVGYTNYEVWVVGAAGGVGGRTAAINWVGDGSLEQSPTTFDVHIPDAVWNAAVALQFSESYSGPGTGLVWVEGRYVPYGQWNSQVWQPLSPPRWMSYNGEYQNYINPTHNGYTVTWESPTLYDTSIAYEEPSGVGISGNRFGGGGGGGGVIVASGLLEELDDLTDVVVGRMGANGPAGQSLSGDPAYVPMPPNWDMRTNYMMGMFQDNHYFSAPADLAKVATVNAWAETYPLPHGIIPPPGFGVDGGASSFGDVAASGGKGGFPAIKWTGSPLVRSFDQRGGDGGIGGTDIAGGGGLGSVAQGASGKDGTWDGDIGAGGGGGFGGYYDSGSGLPMGGGDIIVVASNGGQGSYSYADPSVFGIRQYRQPFTGEPGMPNLNPAIIPGGGGGVKVNEGALLAGSKATGYSPDGAVFIRIFKVE
jgi:hypothetical protein